jgi:hypothetical protein
LRIARRETINDILVRKIFPHNEPSSERGCVEDQPQQQVLHNHRLKIINPHPFAVLRLVPPFAPHAIALRVLVGSWIECQMTATND